MLWYDMALAVLKNFFYLSPIFPCNMYCTQVIVLEASHFSFHFINCAHPG